MKKKVLITCLLSFVLLFGAAAMTACGPEEEKKPTPTPPVSTESVKFSDETNPYTSKTWQEYKDLCDWDKKMAEDKVYYQFEGSYSEAYMGDYSRTYLYMNCYEDGLLHATYRKKNSKNRENYYGYWTNVDKKGSPNIVLHIIRYNDKEYNDGVYESVVDNFASDYYEYSSSIIWNQWGTRTVLIYGFHYSPVKSVAVDTTGAKTKYKLGENLEEAGVGITVTRDNGKSTIVENPHENPKCVFTGYDKTKPGKQTITVAYDDKQTTYEVEVADIKSLTVDASTAKKAYGVGDSLDTSGVKATVAYDDNTTKALQPSDCKFTGYDKTKPGKQTITVSYQGKETTYDVEVSAIKSLTVDTSAAKKTYDVGDSLDTAGVKATVAFENNTTKELNPSDCKFTGFDSSAAAATQTVTIEYYGKTATYTVTVKEPTYTGTGKYGDAKGEVSVTLKTAKQCSVAFNGKTAVCEYTKGSANGKTIYTLVAPADGVTGITEEEWAGLHKQYAFNQADYTLAIIEMYEIKSEIMGSISGGTVQRYLFIDADKGECTVTYKYWYASNTDTFVCKYTLDGNTLTLTEQISAQLGGGGANFTKLIKTFTLNANGTATAVTA